MRSALGARATKLKPLPQQPYLFYERRVVTWNVTSPYEYLSVSKPLTYSGTNQADPIFTVAMACESPRSLLAAVQAEPLYL